MSIKELVVGGVVTVFIGGTAYTVNQADVSENFAADTGMSIEQADQYVSSIGENELVPFVEVGEDHISEGDLLLQHASEIDCTNYEYEWESNSLTCAQGKAHLEKMGNDEKRLGRSYVMLDSSNSDRESIKNTISYITILNTDYDHEIVRAVLDYSTIDESKKTNSYNKALLQAALDSE